MKIVLWIGNQPNHKALANKIHAMLPIDAIVVESKISAKKKNMGYLIEKLFQRLFFRSIDSSWRDLMQTYQDKYPDYPAVDILRTDKINNNESYNFTLQKDPDIVIVSGTSLIKEKLLSLSPSIRILNLHTGLSPYVKGGPNCTNWCLSNGQFHLIGNTIMWIDKGIDSGNILTTSFTPLTGKESLAQLHLKVMEHAHSLYIDAIQYIVSGRTQSIKQDEIGRGVTFYTKQWNFWKKWSLIKKYSGLRKAFENGSINFLRKEITVVDLK